MDSRSELDPLDDYVFTTAPPQFCCSATYGTRPPARLPRPMSEPSPSPHFPRPLLLAGLPPELHGHGEHLLHLDDEPTVTASVRRLLQKLGYSITSFNAPTAALEHFRSEPQRFHLVLTDLMMPGMNGLEFAAAVRVLRPGLPIVLFSAFGNGCNPEDIRHSGICEVILKPAGLLPIAEAIRRALDSHSP